MFGSKRAQKGSQHSLSRAQWHQMFIKFNRISGSAIFPAFSNQKSYYSTRSFSKGRETKAGMAKTFNSQVYLNNVTDWILTIINFLLLCRDFLLPRHIFLLYLLVEQHWFLLFGRRHNRISLTILIICNRQLRQYALLYILSNTFQSSNL